MSRDRAAYMRAYRAAQKKPIVIRHGDDSFTLPPIEGAQARIAELEEEVRHLKAELAKRPLTDAQLWAKERFAGTGRLNVPKVDRYSTRPFTPVPKHK